MKASECAARHAPQMRAFHTARGSCVTPTEGKAEAGDSITVAEVGALGPLLNQCDIRTLNAKHSHEAAQAV